MKFAGKPARKSIVEFSQRVYLKNKVDNNRKMPDVDFHTMQERTHLYLKGSEQYVTW